jgi:hypothetical protein
MSIQEALKVMDNYLLHQKDATNPSPSKDVIKKAFDILNKEKQRIVILNISQGILPLSSTL